jgi:hypothetical protein
MKWGIVPVALGHADMNIIAMIIPHDSVACSLSSLYGRKSKKESSSPSGE